MENPILKKELEFFESKRAELLREHAGKYVLIHEGQLVGAFERKSDALKAGYERFGKAPFLVRLVADTPKRVYFMSNVALCHPCEPSGR